VNSPTPEQLVDMAMYDLAIDTPVAKILDTDIKKVMHYIGVWVIQVETPSIESTKISMSTAFSAIRGISISGFKGGSS
jgi:hypothetical protein